MIRSLHINNYKSLFDLTLEVGRFNVLIGENGCGKSNILEAIALAGAAAADKLDNEFLVPRGIRNTKPELMRSSFDSESSEKAIEIGIKFEDLEIEEKYILINDNQPYSKWVRLRNNLSELVMKWIKINDSIKIIQKNLSKKNINNSKKEEELNLSSKSLLNVEQKLILLSIAKSLNKSVFDTKKYLEHGKNIANKELEIENFVIYSPENTALRNFYKEGQIQPLGINGEGLLKLLKVIQNKSSDQFQEIDETLQLFDWYDNFELNENSEESKITIKDRYLTQSFDQRSANEGFLFVLFYIALMVSDDTPKIFAIDNIDVSLNPKLCTKLIKELVRLSKKYDKQVFVTTHNLAILDGINLGDEEQRLLVVSRNKQGHTRVKHIELKDKPTSSIIDKLNRVLSEDKIYTKQEILDSFAKSEEPLKLSEAFLRGYLGGLPKGF
jgi:predicted ATPase